MQKVNTAGYQTDCFVGEKAVASQLRKRTLCSTVTNFNNGSEASCGSDTKDELHIVEDDSLQEPEVTKADGTTPEDSHDATTTVLPHNGSLNRVKDTLVEEILQQGDTAIIYPEAPEDEQSPAETGGADENGTPDSFSQLLTCPYCSRIFKHKASLKVHIKYRHETSEDNYSCPHCSYTYYHRWKLERHMMRHHRGTREQVTSKLKGINSVKGFISPPTTQTTPVVIAPTRVILKEKTESKPLQEQLPVTQIKSEPVEYECKPVTAAPATSAGTNGVVNGGTAQPAGVPAATLPQGVAMVVPTVGLMSPISINLNDLQNVLKVAMDGNILRQVLGTANGVVTQGKQGIVVQQPQQQIISLPAFVDHDGTTKIIINYSISPAAATTATTQPAPLVAKNNPPLPPTVTTAADPTPTDRTPTPEAADLTIVKAEPESVPIMETEAVTQTESVKTSDAQTAQMPKVSSTSTCLLCDDCPDNLEALHLLQHRKAANGEAVDSAALDPSFAALLNEAGVTLEECMDDLLSLLKTCFASNANPSEAELTKISESVSIPVDVVRKWFAKMNSGKNVGKCRKKAVSKKTETTNSSSKNTSNQNGEAVEDSIKDTSNKASSESGSASPSDCSPLSPNTEDLIIVKSEPDDPEASDSQAEPLDLSLPKHIAAALKTITTPPAKQQEQPLNLTCLRKEQLEGRTIYVTTPQTGRSVNIVTAAQLPTLVAIAGQGTMSCLSAINTTTKRTILIPQLTYTYATTAGNATGAKTVVLNGHKETRLDSNSDGVSTVEEQNDSDSASLIKKRRLENGVYPCDLCSKVFQKGSSLLRHKYEHTGKRPHECNTCKKAFKHKHHLIEHSRLHSGEKPYQCDKCGKRFSHSGSYSQHMNHRYSYCKKDGPNSGSGSGPRRAQSELGSPGPGPHSDSRTTTPPSQLDSDERESEEEEDEDDEAMCMDDIRVVQVDDGECEIYEGNFDDDDEDGEEVVEEETTGEGEAVSEKVDDEVVCDVLEVELGDDHMEDDEIEETTEEKEDGEMEETTEEKEDREMEETTEEKEDREIGETAEEKEDGEMEETTEEKEDGEIGETAEEKEDGEMEETTEEKEDEEMEETTEEKEDEEIRETNEEKEDEEIGETTEEKEDEEIGETNEEKEDEEIGETTEEKEEAANVDTEGVADCEENTDKCIREGSDSTEPTEEVMTNAK